MDEAGQIYAAAEAADRMYILLAGSVQLELSRTWIRARVRVLTLTLTVIITQTLALT